MIWQDGHVFVWDIDSLGTVCEFDDHIEVSEGRYGIAAPRYRQLSLGCRQGCGLCCTSADLDLLHGGELWPLPAGLALWRKMALTHVAQAVKAVAFCPDGRRIASCAADKTLKVELYDDWGHLFFFFSPHAVVCTLRAAAVMYAAAVYRCSGLTYSTTTTAG